MTDHTKTTTFNRRHLLLASAASAVALTGFPALSRAEMAAPANQFLSMGTSSVGGSWFAMGGAITNLISQHVPELQVTAEASGGAVDNLNLIRNGQIELGLTTSAEAYQARNGIEPFEEPFEGFSAIMSGGSINWQLYTLASTGITSIRDLRGKRVSLGAPGSIGNMFGRLVIEAHGLKMVDDWSPDYLGHSDGPDALRDGAVDAVLIVSTFPTAPILDLTSTHGADVRFLGIEPEVMAELRQEHPYLTELAIPGGIYPGHDEETPGSFGVATLLVAAATLSNETAYAIVKAICENGPELSAAHASGRDWVLERAATGISGVLPFHPGAEAYLRERGAL